MNNSLVYFLRKGVVVYTTKEDSYIVSYLLDKCHINYFYNDVVTFKDKLMTIKENK